MITVISGTNRPGSKTKILAQYIYDQLGKMTEIPVSFCDLEALNGQSIGAEMYGAAGQNPQITQIQDENMLPAQKFVVVAPEYNGSFPGILKYFIDACSIREYKATFNGKKATLFGVASGRAGNLRGLDQLTGILHHVGTDVMPQKLPISQVESLLNDKGELVDKGAQEAIHQQLEAFLNY